MIDIENKVYTNVASALRTAYPSIYVCSEYADDRVATFPCVTIDEVENTTYGKTQDNNLREHHANIVYEVNVYSDLKNGRKTQAKQIANKVDELMQDMKFTRTTLMRTPNQDSTIYRITLRYEAVVGEGVSSTVGETTTITHQMYRR